MGYTHYWYRQIDVEVTDKQWKKITDFARQLYVFELESDINLVWESDEPDKLPEITDSLVRFNSVGEEGHETFYFDRYEQPKEWRMPTNEAFSFCKTVRKPYDEAVGAMLLAAEHYAPGAWKISSDGGFDDWLGGMSAFSQLTGMAVPDLDFLKYVD